MKKFLKWSVIGLCILVISVVIVLLIAPSFININKYKPIIEKKVAQSINRPFVIKGGLKLKLFPVTCVSLSDLHIGNPKGFKEKDFVSLKSFDVRIKLLPLLLSRDLQVKKFVMRDPKVVLIKSKTGKVNWEFKKNEKDGKVRALELKKKDVELKKSAPVAIPIQKLSVDEFAITNAAIIWIDKVSGKRTGITGINLRLKNVSFTKPIGFELMARLEGEPIKVEGKIGPLGKIPGKGVVPLNVTIKAFKEVSVNMKGKIKNMSSKNPFFDVALNIKPFSPRRLFSRFGGMPFKIADPKALQKLALSAHIKGTPESVGISNGILTLDQSRMDFSLNAKEFKKPNIAFNIKLNKINLDRYLPVSESHKGKGKAKRKPYRNVRTRKVMGTHTSSRVRARAAIDYAPLRTLELNGKIKVGELIAKKARFQNIYARLQAKNGILKVQPLSMDMYKGKMLLDATVDVRRKAPVTRLALNVKNVLIGDMIRDVLKTELLTGTFNLKASFTTKGDTPEAITSHLNGEGELLIKDGSVIGIDLRGMIQNVKAAFGFGKAQKLKRETIFSEIRSKFIIKNGVFQTKETHLLSPKLKVSSKGDANLISKTLNFRVTPEYIKNPEKSIAVPVIVSGTFSSPHFAPDLTGIAKEVIFKKLFKKKKGKGEEKAIEEVGKELLRGLFGH